MSFRLFVLLVSFVSFLFGLFFGQSPMGLGVRMLLGLFLVGLVLGAISFMRRMLEGQITRALWDPVNFHSQGIFDDLLDPMLKGLITILREKQETSSMLAEVRSRFEGVLDHMVEGVAVTSSAGQILLVNSAFGKILGLDGRSLKGSRLGLVIRETAVHELIDEVFRSQSKVVREVEFYEGGNRKTLNVVGTFSAPPDGSGKNYGIFLFYDLSTVRALERIRKDFVANVSHEIRSPLTSIRGYTEALLDGALATPELAQNFLRVIAGQSDRLSRMVNDLLELSRLESGTVSLTMSDISLARQIARLREIFSERLSKKGITLGIAFPDSFIYSSDEAMMDLVLTNLLDNAIKYSHEAGTVRIQATKESGSTSIQIEDQGVGIPRDELSRVFERFYRVDRARSGSVGGTGLGLSIVRHVVGILQGRVELKSELGSGTSIRILLPDNPDGLWRLSAHGESPPGPGILSNAT